jgi:hypothetical protein
MTASTEPQTFEEAVSRFQEFLRKNGWSANLVWVESADLLISGRGAIYVKLPVPSENLTHARDQFTLGMSNGLGILFGTICELKNATCCFAWVPKDQAEQVRSLMGSGLKMSARIRSCHTTGKAVNYRFYWLLLKRRYEKYSDRIGFLLYRRS